MTLYWRVLAPAARDGLVVTRIDQPLAVQVVAGEARLAYPGNGTTPPRLLEPDGGVYADWRQLVAPALKGPVLMRFPSDHPPYRQPILARLSVHLYDPTTGDRWSLDGAGERSEWSTDVVIEPQPRSNRRDWLPEPALVARFENGVRLYHGAPKHLAGWEATAPVGEDLSAFIHLVDGDGNTVAELDRPPASAGRFPTSSWRPGDFVLHRTSRGAARTATGGRLPGASACTCPSATGPRVPAYRPDGTRWPDDAVVIPFEEDAG